jgi:hypothetical protein
MYDFNDRSLTKIQLKAKERREGQSLLNEYPRSKSMSGGILGKFILGLTIFILFPFVILGFFSFVVPSMGND